MRLYVPHSRSQVALSLQEGFYVFDLKNIVYKTRDGVFLHHNNAVPPGENIVDVFTGDNPDMKYRSVTELPLVAVIVPLRRRIYNLTP